MVRLAAFLAAGGFAAGAVAWRRGRAAAAVFLGTLLPTASDFFGVAVGTGATTLTGCRFDVVESSIMTSAPRIFLRARSVAPFARGSVRPRGGEQFLAGLPHQGYAALLRRSADKKLDRHPFSSFSCSAGKPLAAPTVLVVVPPMVRTITIAIGGMGLETV